MCFLSCIVYFFFFFFNFWRTHVLFVGPLIPLFGLLVMSALGFKARVDSLACFLACVLFLRFTSGATPADLLTASMAADFDPCTCSRQTYPQALVVSRLEPWLEPMAWARARTHDLPCCSTTHLTTRPFWLVYFLIFADN